MEDALSSGPTRQVRLTSKVRLLATAAFLGIAATSALSSTTRQGATSTVPSYEVADSNAIAARIAVSPGPTGPAPIGGDRDDLGGPFQVAARTRLGVCVEDTTGTIADASARLSRLDEAVSNLAAAHPDWAARQMLSPPLLAPNCPLPSPLLNPEASTAYVRHGVVSVKPTARVSPFAVFVYIAPRAAIESFFPKDGPVSRQHSQEVLCRNGDIPCVAVTTSVYVSPDEFLDTDQLRAAIGGALSLERAPNSAVSPAFQSSPQIPAQQFPVQQP